MKIRVNLKKTSDNSYDIVIGKDLRPISQELINSRGVSKYFIITDSNLERLYRKKFLNLLRSDDVRFHFLVITAGEKSKNRSMKEKLEDKMVALKADRDSVVVAFGGGMIGDLGGYTASTFMRGIPYIQIPTSLLSQVDSSIGGKVAVNHPKGKNLIGAFYQPKKVYIDVNTLRTLPEREFRSGFAEVIKYATILDREFFSFLENERSSIIGLEKSSILHIVGRCCKLKKRIVEKDEKETGIRAILNFGHTIGHALESTSAFKLLHGEAVAIGMAAESKISFRLGLLPKEDLERIIELIRLYRLPTHIPEGTKIGEIVRATLHDKKNRNGSVKYTLPEKIGKARIGVSISSSEVIKLIDGC